MYWIFKQEELSGFIRDLNLSEKVAEILAIHNIHVLFAYDTAERVMITG